MKHVREYLIGVVAPILVGVLSCCACADMALLPLRPVEAIPQTTSFFLEVQQVNLSNLPVYIQQLANALPGVEADLATYAGLPQALNIDQSPNAFWLLLQNTQPDRWNVAVVLDQSEIPASAVTRLASLLEQPSTRFATFLEQKIYFLATADSIEVVLAQYQNLIIISSLAAQVEECIATLQQAQSSVFEEAALVKLYRTGKAAPQISLYLNPNYRTDLWDGLQQTNERTRLGSPTIDRAGWLRVNLLAEESHRRIDGSYLPSREEPFAHLPQTSQVRWDKLFRILPANVTGLQTFNAVQWVAHAKNNGAATDEKFQDHFLPWVNAEMAYGWLEPYGGALENRQFRIFGADDVALASEQLIQLSSETGLLEQLTHQTYPLYQIFSEQLFANLPGNHLPLPFRNPWYTVIDQYVVFATSRSVLEYWIDQYIVGNTLEKAMPLLEEEYDAAAFWYLDGKKSQQWAISRFRTPALATASAESGLLYLRFEHQDERITFNGRLAISAEQTAVNDILWRKQLPAKLTHGPYWLSTSGQGDRLAAQDEFNTLYCWDLQGNLRWQKTLDGPLLSPVYVVSAADASEGELVCNTASTIYRLGIDDVETRNETISLVKEAATALTPVYFPTDDANAFFITAVDGKIYGYDQTGQLLPNWDPWGGGVDIRHPVVHTQSGDQDYFFALLQDSLLAIVGRNGQLHDEPIPLSEGPFLAPQIQLLPDLQRVVVPNQRGLVHVINLAGTHFKLRLPRMDTLNVSFAYEDVTADQRKDYILTTEKTVSLHYYEGQALQQRYRHAFSGTIDKAFVISRKNQQASIGALNQKKQQIYLLTQAGTLQPGFPLAGTTPFVIAPLSNGKEIVAVGYQDWLYVYSLR